MFTNKKSKEIKKARLLDLKAVLLKLIETSEDEGERDWLELQIDNVENKLKEL